MPQNVYFELTEAFNEFGSVAILASGQAVVYYRVAILSKDGDWILRESGQACSRVLAVLAERGARYRPGAPLDLRWLRGGWSSHFEFLDPLRRRIRCDFFSRPPRIAPAQVEHLFAEAPARGLSVVDLETLIRMKQTQRAKDYPAIGELARRLAPELEIELTTDPDRVLALAGDYGGRSRRPAVVAARTSRNRLPVVLALAEEIDRLQQEDRRRVDRFERAAAEYLRAVGRLDRDDLALPAAHRRLCELAERLLPRDVGGRDAEEASDEDAQ